MGWMKEEAEKLGMACQILFLEKFSIAVAGTKQRILYDGLEKERPDVVLFRCYDHELAEAFEKDHVAVINNLKSMKLSRDKWATHVLMNQYQIRQPETYKFCGNRSYQQMRDFLGDVFIAKERQSSKGEGVFLIKDEEAFDDLLNRVAMEELIFQEFIEECSGEDIRVYVVGRDIIGAVRRFSESDFRSNFSLGGNGEAFPVDDELEAFVLRIVAASELEVSGIDILKANDGYMLCEINANAGFRTLYQYCSANVPASIMAYIHSAYSK